MGRCVSVSVYVCVGKMPREKGKFLLGRKKLGAAFPFEQRREAATVGQPLMGQLLLLYYHILL